MPYEGEFVRLEVDAESGVGTIRLDRPPMNAMARQVWYEIGDAALAELLEECEAANGAAPNPYSFITLERRA